MQIMINEIKNWIKEAAELIKKEIAKNDMTVDTKNGRRDLVTNVDKQVQDFLIEQINAFDPDAKILGEENGKDHLTDFSGRVFIIDPIDGTLNFVLEQENFCIMIAVYEEGQGKLGFIYNVMEDMLLWGGKEVGVFINEERLNTPPDLALKDGLVGMNSSMYRKNSYNAQVMAERSMGVRMSGCAGLEMIALIRGKHNAYVSSLAPWDYAAGSVMLEALGIKFSNINGKMLKFDGREHYIAATPTAYEEMMRLAEQAKS
ncbi:inositol monophosphatase family protein [Tetragenococcus koreensis]|uniref:Inositol monophosphatase n=1 Tax=Tetragenococcus koreensis TaxID=290335 RepID=A0AAN4RKE7_9ENTE|nr:inositol monophosphatase family protein [Tetragenococcus koreensis]AYW46819.1 inositol monophosphatase [Tetragenococcus koreensis]MCF1584486.1 inositol monophosphatase family protein [Tetragenococcus koreensis]MCF1614035.1 inositol monophosphatase family protein [Tetragenococcus koreensis]MCF1616545.1 inositol monophosphatase family protein [Tetragenococcus koreensis]MCF1618631.1 inositol monophosphatase family protein [Tetragenococcus koreensis]